MKENDMNTVSVPLIPLRGMYIFPGMRIHFDIGRHYTKKALEKAMDSDKYLILSSQKDPYISEFKEENINRLAILCRVAESVLLNNGDYRVIIDGLERVEINEITHVDGYYSVDASIIKEYENLENQESILEKQALKRVAIDKFREFTSLKSEIPNEVIWKLENISEFSRFVDIFIGYLNVDVEQANILLLEFDSYKRLEMTIEYMEVEVEILKLQKDINQKVNKRLNQSQKEYFLREQIHVIRKELDEEIEGKSYDEETREKIEALPIKQEHKDHLIKELNRIEYIHSSSPDSGVIRTYLDNVLDIPFGEYSEDEISIKNSRKILERDHHGLKDVKERILEFLAVKKLKENMKGSVLCLVGPPGVGKTSIVKSVAESMNREYISMRLGGLSDESEIRGHRKTYVGAMPGRIISSLQKAKTLNPVFLLDEIDKISIDYRSDPSAALLEVLDPNQNDEFVDRYIEIPVDLSRVMFVTTANTTETIPQALKDRMEIIRISGYTEYDKLIIAKKYLLPKQIKEHGLDSTNINISDFVLEKIIKNYTREAGVRNLEREITKIIRKVVMKIVEGKTNVRVSKNNYLDFLGKEKFLDDDIVKTPQKGIVTGLAWTEVGGELLQIEVSTMKGKGNIQLTGSLGDVMKESAMTAISYIKSNSDDLNITKKINDQLDIHIHVPEGATPKDGPSAGITMLTALVSEFTDRRVRQDVAMTGEVTLRGRVLPIGGLKEKALAALRYGINKIIIPKQNERDIEDFPEEVKEKLEFYPVKNINEVLEIALEKEE